VEVEGIRWADRSGLALILVIILSLLLTDMTVGEAALIPAAG